MTGGRFLSLRSPGLRCVSRRDLRLCRGPRRGDFDSRFFKGFHQYRPKRRRQILLCLKLRPPARQPRLCELFGTLRLGAGSLHLSPALLHLPPHPSFPPPPHLAPPPLAFPP